LSGQAIKALLMFMAAFPLLFWNEGRPGEVPET